MVKLNIKIFNFLRKHKVLLFIILILSTLIFLYFGTKIHFEEDLTKLLPSTQIGSSEELVFDNVKVKDKVFLQFVPKTDDVDAYHLSEVCDAFSDSLMVKDTANKFIDNILYRIDADLFQNVIGFLYENAPTFIDSADFAKMELLFTKENIDQQMVENLKTLSSASGMAYYDIIRNDPIGLRNIFLAKGGGLTESLGGNFKVIENHFFTPDSTIALAFLSPNFSAFDAQAGVHLIKSIETEIAEFQQIYPDIEILYHGQPVQGAFNSRQIKKDLVYTLGISILLVCILIFYCFRNPSTLPLLILPVIYGMLFGLTCMYLLKGSMSLMAMGLGAVVLGVALSYCIHILTHYKYVSSPKTVIKDQTVPVILGCLTTIGAFMGLMFTQSELLRDFGLFSSLALVGTTIACLFFLPQFLHPRKNKRSKAAFKVFEKINSFPFEKQKWLVIVIVIICGISFYTDKWVTFNPDLKAIGYHEPAIKRSLELYNSKIAPDNIITYFATTSKNLDSAIIYNLQMTKTLENLKKEGKISKYSQSATLMTPIAEQQSRIRRWNEFWTPEKQEEITQMIVESGEKQNFKPAFFDPFFEMLKNDYQPISIYEAEILPDGIMSNLVELSDDTYMVFVPVQVKPEHRPAVCDILTSHQNCVVIDPMYYTGNMMQLISDDYNVTLWISSLFVFVVLLLSFRSIILATVAFIPMFLSWHTVLGIMGIFGLEFNIINIVISTFIFGVGVDYSIFIMKGLLAKANHNNRLIVYHKTAILISAIVLIFSISSLMFAKHIAISSVGLITLIGMCSTVIITYTLEPFLFGLMQKNKFLNKIIQKRMKD